MKEINRAVVEAARINREWLADITRYDPALRERAHHINLRRLLVVCAVGIPISAAHVVLFWAYAPGGTETQELWRRGIITSHASLLLVELLLLVVSFRLVRGSPSSWRLQATQYTAIAVVAAAGAAITGVDQLVTPNMTPFLIAAILIAVIFLLHPFAALAIYAGSFVLFHVAVGISQPDASIVLSNRVNGLTAVGLGFSLSVMLWTAFLRRAEQQKRIEEQQQRLEALATVDPLTGLLNRRGFEEAVATEVARLERTRAESCLLVMDMDDFKQINDSYGHPVGDEVLRSVARILRDSLRRYDILARWGGEEFIMLFPDTDLESGRDIAQKLHRTIENTQFHAGGHSLPTTASIGLALLRTEADDVFQSTYVRTDAALYRAKRQGRNRVEVDDGAIPEHG